MGASGFYLSGSGIFGDKFIRRSLTAFGGRTGDLCELCFVEDFLILYCLCSRCRFCVCFSFDYFIGFLFICCDFFSLTL